MKKIISLLLAVCVVLSVACACAEKPLDTTATESDIAKLESLYAQMETAKGELGKPFPQEEELRVKAARLAELNIELNIDDKTPLEALAEEAPQSAIAKSANRSVLQKLHSYSAQSHSESRKTIEEVR